MMTVVQTISSRNSTLKTSLSRVGSAEESGAGSGGSEMMAGRRPSTSLFNGKVFGVDHENVTPEKLLPTSMVSVNTRSPVASRSSSWPRTLAFHAGDGVRIPPGRHFSSQRASARFFCARTEAA